MQVDIQDLQKQVLAVHAQTRSSDLRYRLTEISERLGMLGPSAASGRERAAVKRAIRSPNPRKRIAPR